MSGEAAKRSTPSTSGSATTDPQRTFALQPGNRPQGLGIDQFGLNTTLS
ncbi:MAG: hypothetical protein JO270_19065 [Acidobacteriaceae bacterium]|nr:hypothetical protein [Acidobacteriaceae bacterium]